MGGSASDLYAQAIKASMTENGLTDADATAYLANNPYNSGNWKQSIGYESYVAMWNNPFACWNFVRRLDYPVLIAACIAGRRFGLQDALFRSRISC